MQLSKRISGLTGGGDGGWEVFYRARALKASGVDVTELTIGEHDIGTHPSILEAMHRAAMGGHTGYAVTAGERALREMVAERVQARTRVPTTFENVLITPGGQAALFAAHHAVCDEGDVALYLDPYYATYPGTLRAVGAEARAVQTRADNAFQPDAATLAKAAAGAKSLLINSPNNPTGTVYSAETLQTIAEVCVAQDLWLISDEVYDTQIWEGAHLSPRALPGMAERCLVVGSMSKSHAMTGSRCGWVIGPREAIDHMITLATHTTYGVPGYIQDAALFALQQGSALEAEIAAPFRRRRDLVGEILRAQNVIRAIPAQGAMYVMLDIRATGLSGTGFAEALLDAHRIAVMPGESFGDAAAGHIRVALTLDDERLCDALQVICAFAEGLAIG